MVSGWGTGRAERQSERERIVIAGAGIAGLATALALSHAGREVVLLERDGPPPVESGDAAFNGWPRPGVPQIHHSHGFFGRLRNLLSDRYPELYAELLAAGVRERRFFDGLPPWLLDSYQPRREDEELTGLYCRRTTFERVLHRHVASRPEVSLQTGVRVLGLLSRQGERGRRVVVGVTAERDGPVEIGCDVLIDACGRRSPFIGWIRELGADIAEESHDTGIIYFTRFYRLRSGCAEPDGQGHPRVGDLGYLKFGIFPADQGTFSITLVVPTLERDLMRLHHNEAFDKAGRALPLVAEWMECGEPITDVFSTGGHSNRWRRFVDEQGGPVALGYFAVGEAALRANPLYGSGCSLTFVHAHLLAETLIGMTGAWDRALSFDTMSRQVLYPFYREALRRDREGLRRARRNLDAGEAPRLGERLQRWFLDHGVTPAMRGDTEVRRAIFRDMHLLGPPGTALRRPGILLRIIRFLLRGPRGNAAYYPPPLGPERAGMLQLLGLEAPPDQTDP